MPYLAQMTPLLPAILIHVFSAMTIYKLRPHTCHLYLCSLLLFPFLPQFWMNWQCHSYSILTVTIAMASAKLSLISCLQLGADPGVAFTIWVTLVASYSKASNASPSSFLLPLEWKSASSLHKLPLELQIACLFPSHASHVHPWCTNLCLLTHLQIEVSNSKIHASTLCKQIFKGSFFKGFYWNQGANHIEAINDFHTLLPTSMSKTWSTTPSNVPKYELHLSP